jgi:hypothetical protein
MLYGLLLQGVAVEAQAQAALPALDDDEYCWLGMEAWVCCEPAQTCPSPLSHKSLRQAA